MTFTLRATFASLFGLSGSVWQECSFLPSLGPQRMKQNSHVLFVRGFLAIKFLEPLQIGHDFGTNAEGLVLPRSCGAQAPGTSRLSCWDVPEVTQLASGALFPFFGERRTSRSAHFQMLGMCQNMEITSMFSQLRKVVGYIGQNPLKSPIFFEWDEWLTTSHLPGL